MRFLRIREEPALLAAALAAVLAALAFLRLASEVLEGDPLTFDSRLLLLFRRTGDLAHTTLPQWVTETTRDLSALGGPVVSALVVAAAAGYCAIRRRWIAFWTVVAASVGGSFLAGAIKLAYHRERPDASLHLMPATSPGFPSGHSMESAVIYLTLGAMIARLVPGRAARVYVVGVAMLAVILVGVSRVYLGVHYPSDVLAGWAIGLLWALLCWMAARRLIARAAPHEEPGEANAGDRS